MTVAPELHPDCIDLAPLLGTWKGSGDGHYPTIESFEYREELTFSHVGKPFLAMNQRTSDASTGQPLHAEAGYLRAVGDGIVELVVAQPSGIVEINIAEVEPSEGGLTLDFRSDRVETAPAAKSVTEVRRRFSVDADEMIVEMWMAAVGEPMQHHLRSRLERV